MVFQKFPELKELNQQTDAIFNACIMHNAIPHGIFNDAIWSNNTFLL